MEDKYIYRGKLKWSNTGEYNLDWVFGNLVVELKTNRHFILDLSYYNADAKLKDVMLEVIPETVGQCTGLKDKIGRLVFNGDIVRDCYKTKYLVKYNEEFFCFSFYIIENKQSIFEAGNLDTKAMVSFYKLEVIGNRFENKGLLKR